MTKEQLIKLMEAWPQDTIVRVSSWPFVCDIEAVQCDPQNGRANLIVNRDSWFMREFDWNGK